MVTSRRDLNFEREGSFAPCAAEDSREPTSTAPRLCSSIIWQLSPLANQAYRHLVRRENAVPMLCSARDGALMPVV